MSSGDATGTEPFRIEAELISLLHDMSSEDLSSFAESQEDSTSDEQIELYIYICFFIFKRAVSIKYLQQAVQRAEGWVAITATRHPDHARRLQILDMLSAWMSQVKSSLEDAALMALGNR